MHHGNLLVILLGVCVNTGFLFEAFLATRFHPTSEEDKS
jgi:hypothetical protein